MGGSGKLVVRQRLHA